MKMILGQESVQVSDSDTILNDLVRRTPSLRLDIFDPRPLKERILIHREIVEEAIAHGLLEQWSYAVRMRFGRTR